MSVLVENNVTKGTGQRDIFFHFSKGRAGTSHVNCRYLLRAEALDSQEQLTSVYVQNYPAHIRDANYEVLKVDVVDFNRLVEGEENRFITLGATCTHYRIKISFKGKLATEYVRKLGIEYVQKQFPDSVALAVVHQNTNNTHIHVHLQAREITGNKLHIALQVYKKLDVGWGEIFGREFGREILARHLEKKVQTHQHKIAQAVARKAGLERTPSRPNRVTYNRADYLAYERRITDVTRESLPSASPGEPTARVSRAAEPTLERSAHDNGTGATTADRVSRSAELRARVGEYVRTLKDADQQVSRAEPALVSTQQYISRAAQQTERTIQRARELVSEYERASEYHQKLTREFESVGQGVNERTGATAKLQRGYERLGQDVSGQTQQSESLQQRIGREGEQVKQIEQNLARGNQQVKQLQRNTDRLTSRVREFSQEHQLGNQQRGQASEFDYPSR